MKLSYKWAGSLTQDIGSTEYTHEQILQTYDEKVKDENGTLISTNLTESKS